MNGVPGKNMKRNAGNAKYKVQSLKSVSIKLLVLFAVAVAGLLVFLVFEIQENRKLMNEYVNDTAGLYVNQINRDITQITSELIYILEGNDDISSLPDQLTPSDTAYYDMLTSIMEQNRILKIRYQETSFFYVYSYRADVLITDSGTTFAGSWKSDLYEELLALLKGQEAWNSNTTQWTLLYVGEDSYIVSWYTKNGKTFGCVMDVDTVFDILGDGISSYEAIPFMKDEEGNFLLPKDMTEEYRELILEEKTEKNLCSYQLGSIGVVYLYIVPGSGMLERLLNIQVFFAVLVAVIMMLCVGVLYGYYRRVMEPMREFVDGLDRLDEEQMLNEDGTNNILELQFASGQFRKLLRKIQSLKIIIYERELKEQKAELEYVQEQLRPHFLLNCLSVIHGKADEKGETEIVRITEKLADYMRYVMRDSHSLRRVSEELEHIEAYVEMQKLRYGEDSFSYEVMSDADVGDCLIPPLVLQTLVENAIVHEVTLDAKVEISLYITVEKYEETPYLYISVSDTGSGFSEEILEALEKDSPIVYNGRTHIGLQNVRRRLDLMYGGRAGIIFSNMEKNFGAVVEVRLPLERAGDGAETIQVRRRSGQDEKE